MKRFHKQTSSSITWNGRHENSHTALKNQTTPGTGEKCKCWTAQKEIIVFLFEGSENVWSVCADSSKKQTARDVWNRDVIPSELIMSEGFYMWYRIHHRLPNVFS